MENTLVEVQRVNEYLDQIKRPKDLEETTQKIEELRRIKEKLINKGFNTSFIPTSINLSELTKGEIAEIRKQIKEFKYITYLKRNTLRRINYSIAAHKIAAFYFRTKSFSEIVDKLAYDGEILTRVSKCGHYCAKTYFKLYEFLSGDIEQIGISVEMMVPSERGYKRKKIQLYKTRDITRYVSENYGPETQIIKTRIISKHKSILNTKAIRKVIATAYATLKKPEYDLKMNEKVKEYYSILKKYGIKELIRVDATVSELKEEMLEELYKRGMITYGRDETIIIEEELDKELVKLTNNISWIHLKQAYKALIGELIKTIMKTSKKERKKAGIFGFDEQSSVETILKEMFEISGMLGLIKTKEMILNKMELEDKLPFKKVGEAIFIYYQGKERFRKLFNEEPDYLKVEVEGIKKYLETKGEKRADKFLKFFKK